MQASADQNAVPDVEILTFSVSDHEYSIDIKSVREIRGWTETTRLPMAPDYIHGVINLRGIVLPVVDLSARLGFEDAKPSSRSVIIVAESKSDSIGIQVDAVSDIIAVPTSDIQPPPKVSDTEGQDFISGVTVIEDKIIRMLDIGEITR